MSKSLNLQTVINTGEARDYRASLINGEWYGKRLGKYFPINIPPGICNKLSYIFSSKTNDYWEEGTIKKHDKLNRKDYKDTGFWTPFRYGFIFRGTLINERINVDWTHHQIIAKKEYGKTYNRSIKNE